MIKMYRTPPILANMSRGSKRIDSSGKLLETDKEQVSEAPNVLSRILKKLDILIDKEVKNPKTERKPITQNMLGEEAATKGSSYERYDYVFKDTLEMVNDYFLPNIREVKTDNTDKDNADKAISEFFETYGKHMDKKRCEIFNIVVGQLAEVSMERYGDFETKVCDVIDAFTAHIADGLRIHPSFGGYGVNDLADMIYKKYQDVQELNAEYDRLKAESSKLKQNHQVKAETSD